MLCVSQCVFLKNIINGKFRDVGWVGGLGEDDTSDNLGRGGLDFLQLMNIVDGYPYLQQLFVLDKIGSDVDEVIEGEEGIFFFCLFFSGPGGTTIYHYYRQEILVWGWAYYGVSG